MLVSKPEDLNIKGLQNLETYLEYEVSRKKKKKKFLGRPTNVCPWEKRVDERHLEKYNRWRTLTGHPKV